MIKPHLKRSLGYWVAKLRDERGIVLEGISGRGQTPEEAINKLDLEYTYCPIWVLAEMYKRQEWGPCDKTRN